MTAFPSIISGPVATVVVGALALAALVVWLLRPRRYPGPRLLPEDDTIDRETLEEAEREVRDLGAEHRPDERILGDDWGPGTPRPPKLL